jgi:imidazolonepropionase-like amidohydrolase
MHRLAIRAGALFDGVGPAAVPDPVVLVEDGRIAAVTAGPVPLSAGTPLLELPGATLLPGLVDAHVHLGSTPGPTPSRRWPPTTTPCWRRWPMRRAPSSAPA